MDIIIKIVSFLLIAFIGALLGHFVWPDILDTIEVKVFGKPKIIVNVNEIHLLKDEQYLEDFVLMFGTANGRGMLVAAQLGHRELNKLFGDVAIPTDFGKDGNTLEYFIGILNEGNRDAKDVSIVFSGNGLKTNYAIDVDKRIDFVNCGGSGSRQTCDIRVKKLLAADKVALFVRADTPSIADVGIVAKGNYDSFVNFRKAYIRMVQEGESKYIYFGEQQVIELPPLNHNSNFRTYYYSPAENIWITTIYRIKIMDSKNKEIEVSSRIKTALEELGDEAEARAIVGASFEQTIRKMLQLLEDNGFEITKLKSLVTYSDTGSGYEC